MLRHLRGKKSSIYQRLERNISDRSGLLKTAVLHNVAVKSIGQITDSPIKRDNLLIDDCEYASSVSTGSSARNLIPGRTVFAGHFHSAWGHFLMNSTARLWWAIHVENRSSYDRVAFVVAPDEKLTLCGNHQILLELLGLKEKIVFIESEEAFEELIVPDIAYEHDVYYTAEMMEIFQTAAAAVLNSDLKKNKSQRPIFLSRSKLPNARSHEVNLHFLDRTMAENGYEIIHPEKIPLDILIRKINDAPEVVTVSGSLAHNIVFAQPDKKITILERGALNNLFQISINLMTGQKIELIDAYHLPMLAPHTGRVFLYYPTEEFLSWANSKGLKTASFEKVAFNKRKSLATYLQGYRREYGRLVVLEYETVDQAEALFEAYEATVSEFFDYLRGLRAITVSDYLYPLFWARKLKQLFKSPFPNIC